MPLMAKKKPSSGDKKPNRTGKAIQVWVPPALRDAIEQLADRVPPRTRCGAAPESGGQVAATRSGTG